MSKLTKKVLVETNLIDAWETWIAEIPDDVPEDEIAEYLKTNIGDNEKVALIGIDDSGHSGMTVTSVEPLS